MYKKVALMALCFTAWSGVSIADKCPSVTDIKNKSFSGWVAHDSEDGKPLSTERVAELVKHIDQFALAEWIDHNKPTGAIRCYYRDKHGSDLEAYFAKSNFTPDNTKNTWYQVSGFMHCAAGDEQCSFKNGGAATTTTQLASATSETQPSQSESILKIASKWLSSL